MQVLKAEKGNSVFFVFFCQASTLYVLMLFSFYIYLFCLLEFYDNLLYYRLLSTLLTLKLIQWYVVIFFIISCFAKVSVTEGSHPENLVH